MDQAWNVVPGGGVTASIIPRLIAFLSEKVTQNEICLLTEARIALLRPTTNETIGDFGKMILGRPCDSSYCWPSKVDDLEFAVPLNRVAEAIRDVQEIASKTKTCFPMFGLYLRFGLQKDSLIGATRSGPVAYVEVHILKNPTGGPHIGYPFIDELRQVLVQKYGGQPHFGKNFVSDFYGIESRIESFEKFRKVAEKYDPKGLFQNKFLRSLSKDFLTPFTPECALTRTCICKEDVHCPKNWRCINGAVYPETRVCKKGRGVGCGRGDECASGECSLFQCL
jgi:hypothetical protein